MSASVAIVLVETESVDNLGAVARAMKNMCLTDLRLVKPPRNWKTGGKKMAVNAYDLLLKASVYKTLQEAVADCHVSVGFSRRRGYRRRDYLPFSKTIELGQKKTKRWKKAYVFGKESKGLSNEQTSLCDWITTIPSNPQFGSLNLAQAVMVTAFCLHQRDYAVVPENTSEDAHIAAKNITETPFLRVTKAEQEDVLKRFEEALKVLEYQEEGDNVVERILGTVNRLLNRAGLLRSEAKMLKGLSRRILQYSNEGPGFKKSKRRSRIGA